jgi:GntR family transcriptional regulator, transcriptional repressor for pyruvate dehydrogenase complex
MPLQAVESKRLYRQIAEQLRALIAAGEFLLGSRLPPERDLALQLGVSRPSVREALIALEVEGLVEVRMGSGIYVTALEPAPAARGAGVGEALGPFDIIRARALIEAELAALAARECTPALLKRLRAAVKAMEDDIVRGVMPMRGDREFHLALAEASDNAALVRVVTELFDERNNPLFVQLGQHFENAKSWRAAVAEHRAVLRAVAAGEAAAARKAMHVHLQASHDRFAAALEEPPPARRAA